MSGMPDTTALDVSAAFVLAAVAATEAMMTRIRPTQIAPRIDLQATHKLADDTVVTWMDRASGAAADAVLDEMLSYIRRHDEETGESVGSKFLGGWLVWKDPLDGTKSFMLRACTETTIIALYNTTERRVVACVIGHPASGRIWVAREGEPTGVLHTYSDHPESQACCVWGGELTNGGTILIDHMGSFKARGGTKLIYDAVGMARLLSALVEAGVDIACYGTNGLHHALVADQDPDSPKGVAAAFTTALGGEWDAAFALGVIQAGGCAIGFRVTENGDLEERDPLNPRGFDMLLTANSGTTLMQLRGIIMATFG
jgi:hypothetical protein